jgi:hypothetical protein
MKQETEAEWSTPHHDAIFGWMNRRFRTRMHDAFHPTAVSPSRGGATPVDRPRLCVPTPDARTVYASRGLMSRLVEHWKTLKHGTPGRRFYDFHRARVERRGRGWPAERVLTLALGVLLLLGGLAIGWLPGPGGFIGIIGAALLGSESRRVAKLLDRIELGLRGAWRFLRYRVFRRPQPEGRGPGD